jgi:hypothetical protein
MGNTKNWSLSFVVGFDFSFCPFAKAFGYQ